MASLLIKCWQLKLSHGGRIIPQKLAEATDQSFVIIYQRSNVPTHHWVEGVEKGRVWNEDNVPAGKEPSPGGGEAAEKE